MTDSDAYKRFLTSAPEAQREYRTIELYHPQFSSVLRFVKDYTDRTLTLESTAPRNPGSAVGFQPIAMNIIEPSENNEIVQVLQVDLGAVGNEVEDQVSQITGDGYLTPIQIIYRKYYSGDISEPMLVITLSVNTVDFESYTSVSFTAEDIDFAIKQSGEIYTIERFPSLGGV